MAGITYFMAVSGELSAAVFAIYLFVTFGNGFRYGRQHLFVSQALSLIGFGIVCWYSDFWTQHRWVIAGVLLAMISLPFYVLHLKAKVDKAKTRAEEANKALERTAREAQQQVRELSRKLAELTPPTA